MYLSDLYEGDGSAEVKVKVLRGNGTGDIVNQYVRFCKISDKERKKYGRTQKAIEETSRRCIEENVLAPFLVTRQKEVAEIMVTLFDQEKVMEVHDYHVAETAQMEGTLKSLQNLMKNMGLSVEQALAAVGIPEAERPQYEALLK